MRSTHEALVLLSRGYQMRAVVRAVAWVVRETLRFIRRRFHSLLRWVRFVKEFWNFRRQAARLGGTINILWQDRYPCLGDKTATTGFDRHYVYHVGWAARILARERPPRHVDVSSSLFFCSAVSAFIPIEHYDYRPPELHLDNFAARRADLMSLPFPDASIQSLSCMHVVEHIGLGRYGDPLDPEGDRKAIAELQRVVSVGGQLLFVVPVGRPRIQFNAHRIYAFEQVIEFFKDWRLVESTLIPDSHKDGGLIRNASAAQFDEQNWGCGCFLFKKV